MRRLLVLALALLAPLVAPPAAASSHMFVDHDVLDAVGDSHAYPDVRLPHTDIRRFTTSIEGEDVVQTVYVVGPWPDNNYFVEIRNSFGSSGSYTLKVERMNSSGANVRPTDYNTSLYTTPDHAVPGKRVNFTFERGEDTMTFRWPAAEIPQNSNCLAPRVTTLSRTTVAGRSTQVDDDLVVTPDLCGRPDARRDGLDGSCDGAHRDVVLEGTIEDARADVAERDGLAMRPHDNATLDILSLTTRRDAGWVVQTVLLAEPSPRDAVQLTIENQYRGNDSEHSRGAYLQISLFETSGSGTIIGEAKPNGFHVRALRAGSPGWELRWCESLVPADATCFEPTVRATILKGRYVDTLRPASALCKPEATREAPTGGSVETDDPNGGASAQKGLGAKPEEKPTPAGGAVLLVAAAFVAIALRRSR